MHFSHVFAYKFLFLRMLTSSQLFEIVWKTADSSAATVITLDFRTKTPNSVISFFLSVYIEVPFLTKMVLIYRHFCPANWKKPFSFTCYKIIYALFCFNSKLFPFFRIEPCFVLVRIIVYCDATRSFLCRAS